MLAAEPEPAVLIRFVVSIRPNCNHLDFYKLRVELHAKYFRIRSFKRQEG